MGCVSGNLVPLVSSLAPDGRPFETILGDVVEESVGVGKLVVLLDMDRDACRGGDGYRLAIVQVLRTVKILNGGYRDGVWVHDSHDGSGTNSWEQGEIYVYRDDAVSLPNVGPILVLRGIPTYPAHIRERLCERDRSLTLGGVGPSTITVVIHSKGHSLFQGERFNALEPC